MSVLVIHRIRDLSMLTEPDYSGINVLILWGLSVEVDIYTNSCEFSNLVVSHLSHF